MKCVDCLAPEDCADRTDGKTMCDGYGMCAIPCANNLDCGSGNFCRYVDPNKRRKEVCTADPLAAMGCTGTTASTCEYPGVCESWSTGFYAPVPVSASGVGNFVIGATMDWWTSKNWCEAQGKKLFDYSDNRLECYSADNTPFVDSTEGYCCCDNTQASCTRGTTCDKTNLSTKMQALTTAFSGGVRAHTAIGSGSCYIFTVEKDGELNNNLKRYTFAHPLCE